MADHDALAGKKYHRASTLAERAQSIAAVERISLEQYPSGEHGPTATHAGKRYHRASTLAERAQSIAAVERISLEQYPSGEHGPPGYIGTGPGHGPGPSSSRAAFTEEAKPKSTLSPACSLRVAQRHVSQSLASHCVDLRNSDSETGVANMVEVFPELTLSELQLASADPNFRDMVSKRNKTELNEKEHEGLMLLMGTVMAPYISSAQRVKHEYLSSQVPDNKRADFYLHSTVTCAGIPGFKTIHTEARAQNFRVKKRKHIAQELEHSTREWLNIDNTGAPIPYGKTVQSVEAQGKRTPWQVLRMKIFEALSEPSSSWLAWVLSFVLMATILVSTVAFILETVSTINSSDEAERVFFYIDLVTVQIFALDYLTRLCTCPNIFSFVFNWLNIIDLIAILPWYIMMGVGANNDSGGGTAVFRVLRLIRIFRLFRLAKNGKGMHAILLTIRGSINEFVLILSLLILLILLTSSIMYYCERGDHHEGLGYRVRDDEVNFNDNGEPVRSPFYTIPATFWWSMVTLMTVGYGDAYPLSPLGKFVACVTMLIGILSLALPISVIGSNFQVVWDQVLKGARVDDQCAQQMCPDMACVMNALDDHSFAMETLNEIMAGEIKNVDALTFELHEKVQLYHDSFDRVYAHLNIPASTSSRLMDAIRSYVEESLTARVTGTPFPPPVLHIPLDAGNSVIHRRSMGTLDPKGGVEVVEARGESVATIPREPAMADEGELASSHASIAEEMKMLNPSYQDNPINGNGNAQVSGIFISKQLSMVSEGQRSTGPSSPCVGEAPSSKAYIGQPTPFKAPVSEHHSPHRSPPTQDSSLRNQPPHLVSEPHPPHSPTRQSPSLAPLPLVLEPHPSHSLTPTPNSQTPSPPPSSPHPSPPPAHPTPPMTPTRHSASLPLPPAPARPPAPPPPSMQSPAAPTSHTVEDTKSGGQKASSSVNQHSPSKDDQQNMDEFFESIPRYLKIHNGNALMSTLAQAGLELPSLEDHSLSAGIRSILAFFMFVPDTITQQRRLKDYLKFQLRESTAILSETLFSTSDLFDESLEGSVPSMVMHERDLGLLEEHCSITKDMLMEADVEFSALMYRTADLWKVLKKEGKCSDGKPIISPNTDNAV